jgi:hypothetical protein
MLKFGMLSVALLIAAQSHAQESTGSIASRQSGHERSQSACERVDIGALTNTSDYSAFVRRDCPEPAQRQGVHALWKFAPPTEIAASDAF